MALDPNPEKLQENVILRFRNLKVRTGSKSVSIVLRCDIYSEYIISMFLYFEYRFTKEQRNVCFGVA